MSYNLIEVKDKEKIEELKEGSALTLEGFDLDFLDPFYNNLVEFCELNKECDIFSIKGYLMNKSYGLTGDNAYPDNLNLISIPLNFFSNVGSLALKRFEFGGRWMDDIVDNNERRESYKN